MSGQFDTRAPAHLEQLGLDRSHRHHLRVGRRPEPLGELPWPEEINDFASSEIIKCSRLTVNSGEPLLISGAHRIYFNIRSLVGLINVFRDYDKSIALAFPLTSVMSPEADFL